jgi:hypothetical protein
MLTLRSCFVNSKSVRQSAEAIGGDVGVRSNMGANSWCHYPDPDVMQTISAYPPDLGFMQKLSVYPVLLG